MKSFKELNLKEKLAKAVELMGFDTMTPIQEETIPTLLERDCDMLGLAATGTGKTAAFSIPILEKMDPSKRGTQALVLCPTRELAIQVAGQINLLAKFMPNKALPVYGGAPYGDQIRGLRDGASIVVGTPGRVIDHLEKGTLALKDLSVVVLDEADEMISMGFREDIETILKGAPEESNIWLFSATMSRDVRKVADDFLENPHQVQINRTEMLPENLEQIYYTTHESNKPEVLCKLIDEAQDFYGLIFCQTKALVTDLAQYLTDKGYKLDCLHGDKDQKAREKTMQAFRDKKVNLLICTDVASRGLDVKDITHVINYSIPRELDSYVHRIGRTARSGKAGFAMSLVTPSHRGLIGQIERMTKSKMKEGKIPTRRDIGMKKISALVTSFSEQKNFARATELMSAEWKEAIGTMTGEEIAARFLSMKFPEIFVEEAKAPSRMAPMSNGNEREFTSRARRDGNDSRSGGGGYRGDRDGGSRDGGGYRGDRDGGSRDGGRRFEKSFDRNSRPGRRDRDFAPRAERAEGGAAPGSFVPRPAFARPDTRTDTRPERSERSFEKRTSGGASPSAFFAKRKSEFKPAKAFGAQPREMTE